MYSCNLIAQYKICVFVEARSLNVNRTFTLCEYLLKHDSTYILEDSKIHRKLMSQKKQLIPLQKVYPILLRRKNFVGLIFCVSIDCQQRLLRFGPDMIYVRACPTYNIVSFCYLQMAAGKSVKYDRSTQLLRTSSRPSRVC